MISCSCYQNVIPNDKFFPYILNIIFCTVSVHRNLFSVIVVLPYDALCTPRYMYGWVQAYNKMGFRFFMLCFFGYIYLRVNLRNVTCTFWNFYVLWHFTWCDIDILELLRFETFTYCNPLTLCDIYVLILLRFETSTFRNSYV